MTMTTMTLPRRYTDAADPIVFGPHLGGPDQARAPREAPEEPLTAQQRHGAWTAELERRAASCELEAARAEKCCTVFDEAYAALSERFGRKPGLTTPNHWCPGLQKDVQAVHRERTKARRALKDAVAELAGWRADPDLGKVSAVDLYCAATAWRRRTA